MEIEDTEPNLSSDQLPITLRDALQALTAINQDIVLLDYGNVIIRRGYQNLTTVRLLGGGVAGTDLSQAIFVGKGMLTAAILGEDSVPSSRQILHTIKELNQGENCGIFVIVQNNADLFNFALAVERANSDSRTRVKLLVIDDDKSECKAKQRYSCGFILLVKVLGALAEKGAFFDEIYKCYQDIIGYIVTVPLNYLDQELPNGRVMSVDLYDLKSRVGEIIDVKSEADLCLFPAIPMVVLVNTYKGSKRLTELGLVKQVIDRLKKLGVCIVRVYYGSFVTTTRGTACLTVMKVIDKTIIQYLDANCDAFGWNRETQFLPEICFDEIPALLKCHGKQQIEVKGPMLGEFQTKILVRAVHFASDALISCERQLNTIDRERHEGTVGNVGTRLKKLSENVNKRLNEKRLPVECPYAFFKKLGIMAESAIGGTMGSIYGVIFGTVSNVFSDLPDTEFITSGVWARVLSHATNKMKQFCSEENMTTTMYFPMECCDDAISKGIVLNKDYIQYFGDGVSAAEEAAQKTRTQNCKYPDPGAHAVGIWMRAVFEAVKTTAEPGPGACDNEN